ncbi:MAG: hypothetical protein WC702_03300 [Patescibacteria group bacterium]|jgi:glutaredoxin-related protein
MRRNFFFPIIIAIAAIAVVALFVVLFKAGHPTLPSSGLTFFYSDTCPHCKNVEDFFAVNEVDKKINVEKLEINGSTENAKLFYNANVACGVTDQKDMGVPLLWDGSTCVNGDEPIITYFQNKLGL